jgi:hypothetical protein
MMGIARLATASLIGSRLARFELCCRNLKQLYPGLILDSDRDPFPTIPAFKIGGVAVCNSVVIPLVPSAAGTRQVAATLSTSGIQAAISPMHLLLLQSFATAVDEVVADVSARARAAAPRNKAPVPSQQSPHHVRKHFLVRVPICFWHGRAALL